MCPFRNPSCPVGKYFLQVFPDKNAVKRQGEDGYFVCHPVLLSLKDKPGLKEKT